ncbi:MAG: glycoside hydrolase family 3 C-terminal domain-containing protein [Firmicutes bacterium]|nr:glycoside hydrolase family 3 C-terminal domain-containing protein [Bacillota bacterium]
MKKRNLQELLSPNMTETERKGIALARQASCEGSVLLENNGTLPIKPCRVALFGFGARHLINTGVGSGDVSARYEIQVEDGLKQAGFEIATTAWLDTFDQIYAKHRKDLREELLKKSEETGIDCIHVWYQYSHEHIACQPILETDMPPAEAAIYVLSRKEGEGRDNAWQKGCYLPADWEVEHIRVLRERYERLIVLLNIGTVLDMQEIRKIGPDAVLAIYQGGAELGYAVADMLTGAVPPSGKLTTTWAEDYWDYSNSKVFGPQYPELMVPYSEGIYFGYRYFDSFKVKPLYAFGYGLTYTQFEFNCKAISHEKDTIRMDVSVQNAGSFKGKQTVQLYLSAPWGKLDKPAQVLCAYAKTDMLLPGESQELSLSFRLADFASYDTEEACYLLEKGAYVLRLADVSDSSRPCGVIELAENFITRKVKNVFSVPIELDEIRPERPGETTLPEDLPRISLNRDDIPWTEEPVYSEAPVNYLGRLTEEDVLLSAGEKRRMNVREDITLPDVITGKATLEELIASMTVEELIHLVTGQIYVHPVYKMNCYSQHVLGCCGETTNYFAGEEHPRKIPFLTTGDGGSGLHLIEKFQLDEKGEIIYLDPVLVFEHGAFGIDGYVDGLPYYYQYTTALPVPTQLANTWNTELTEKLGDVVGAEMERYGVDIWLAPGVNLHRNPLGGRNFEYYSEDPFLTASIASSIARGTQKHPGKGVCVKHMAANNQETNRTSHTACVSERTMREMYLRPFEWVVRDARPFSIMTSLNCVNGPHGTNSHELATSILQDEWGFDGLIMTDWNTTRKDRGASTSACIRAGMHIIMPGSENDLRLLREGLEKDSPLEKAVPLGDLQKSAMGVLRAVIRSMED